jgi:hypothetical protein
MRHVSMKPILATAAFGALLGGCATTVEMGPGYYHYDTGLARPTAPAVVYQEPAAVYREPAAVYREPAVVYREPAVVYEPTVVYRGAYREPTRVYRYGRDSFFYTDHGQ